MSFLYRQYPFSSIFLRRSSIYSHMPYKAKIIFITILSLLLCLLSPVNSSARWVDLQRLESRLDSLDVRSAEIDISTRELLQEVKDSVDRDLDLRKEELKSKIEQWNREIDKANLREMNLTVKEALVIAGENGLDTVKLQRIYDLMRKIIRGSKFMVATGTEPDMSSAVDYVVAYFDNMGKPNTINIMGFNISLDYDKIGKMRFAAEREKFLEEYLNSWFVFFNTEENNLAEELNKQQTYRVRLYKRATVAFIRALLASTDDFPSCNEFNAGTSASTADDGAQTGQSNTGDDISIAGGVVTINGHKVALVGCPDPVVDHLKEYLKAIHKLAGSDADLLMAEADLIVAEQQFAVDVAAGVPLLGEALDIYSVYAGENLAGKKLTDFDIKLIKVMLFIPHVALPIGQLTAPYIKQIGKRLPGSAIVVTRWTMAMEYMYSLADDVAKGATKTLNKHYQEMVKKLAKRWDVSPEKMKLMLARWKILPPDKMERTIVKGLSEAAQNKILLRELPKETAERAIRDSDELLRVLLSTSDDAAIEASGMMKPHVQAMLDVLQRQEPPQILFMRGTNTMATEWIERGAKTKHMSIKPKSASHGPFGGLLPTDQKLNKLGSEWQRLNQKKIAGTILSEELEIMSNLEKGMAKGEKAIAECLTDPTACAKAVPFKTKNPLGGGEVDLQYYFDANKQPHYVIEGPDGKFLDHATGQSVTIKCPAGCKPQTVKVLADVDGIYITADYDIFAYGKRGDHRLAPLDSAARDTPSFSSTQGYTTPGQRAINDEMNEEMAKSTRRWMDRLEKEVDEAGTVKYRDPKTGRVFDEEYFNMRKKQISTRKKRNLIHHGAEQNYPLSPGVDYPIYMLDGKSGRVIEIPSCDQSCMKNWCAATKRCNPAEICGKALEYGCVMVDKDRILKDIFHNKRAHGYDVDPNVAWGWGDASDYNALSGWNPPARHYGETVKVDPMLTVPVGNAIRGASGANKSKQKE